MIKVERITTTINTRKVPMPSLPCKATPAYHLFLNKKLINATGAIAAILHSKAPTDASGRLALNTINPLINCVIKIAGIATIPSKYTARSFKPLGINNKLACSISSDGKSTFSTGMMM